jgi:hypothetical protein
MQPQSLKYNRSAAHDALLVATPLAAVDTPPQSPTLLLVSPMVQLSKVEDVDERWVNDNFLFIFAIALFVVLGVCAAVMSV